MRGHYNSRGFTKKSSIMRNTRKACSEPLPYKCCSTLESQRQVNWSVQETSQNMKKHQKKAVFQVAPYYRTMSITIQYYKQVSFSYELEGPLTQAHKIKAEHHRNSKWFLSIKFNLKNFQPLSDIFQFLFRLLLVILRICPFVQKHRF